MRLSGEMWMTDRSKMEIVLLETRGQNAEGGEVLSQICKSFC